MPEEISVVITTTGCGGIAITQNNVTVIIPGSDLRRFACEVTYMADELGAEHEH